MNRQELLNEAVAGMTDGQIQGYIRAYEGKELSAFGNPCFQCAASAAVRDGDEKWTDAFDRYHATDARTRRAAEATALRKLEMIYEGWSFEEEMIQFDLCDPASWGNRAGNAHRIYDACVMEQVRRAAKPELVEVEA